MPVLKHKTLGDVFVPNELVGQAAGSGDYEVPADLQVQFTTPAGRTVEGSLDDVAAADRTIPISPAADTGVETARRSRVQEQQGGVLGAVKTVAEGVLEGATLGGYGAATRGLFGPEGTRGMREREELRPGVALGSQIAGGVASSFLTGPEGALLPAARAARAGAAIARGGGGGVLRSAAGAAVEGAFQSAGQAVHELAISEDPVTFERAVSSIPSAALLGGVLGAGVGAVGKAAEKGLVRARGAVDEFKASRAAGAATDDVASLDGAGLRKAEAAEVARLEAERVPEHAQLAKDVAAARQAGKAEKPWIALEGFKGKKAAGKAGRAAEAEPGGLAAATPEPAAGQVPEGFSVNENVFFQGEKVGTEVRRGVPTFDELSGLERETVYSLRPSELAKRDVVGFERDAAKLESVERAWSEGKKLKPATAYVDPEGRILLDDGNHRLFVAAGDDRPVLVSFKPARQLRVTDAKPIGEDIAAAFRAGATAADGAALPGLSAAVAREVREIGRVSIESDRMLDRLLRNPKRLAERPSAALGALQQQEHALERLQALEPELRARIAADPTAGGTRLAALDTVEPALVRNRELQTRMAELTADPASPRLDAIRGARDNLTSPKVGLGEQLTRGAVFTGVTAAAAPLGIAAPIIGSVAAKTVGRMVFGRLGRASAEAAERTGKAIDALLATGRKVAPAAVPLATKTLRRMAMSHDAEKPHSLHDLYKARSAEVLSQVERGLDGKLAMRQESRRAVADRLSGVAAVSPKLADKVETHAALRATYLAEKLPKPPELPGMQIGPNRWRPTDRQMRTWARVADVVDNPGAFEERLAAGMILPAEADAYRTIYPERFAEFRQKVVDRLPELQRTLPWQRRLALTIFTGVPVDPSLTPGVLRVMQGIYTEEPGTESGTEAPKAQPQFGSISREQPTPAQSRQVGE